MCTRCLVVLGVLSSLLTSPASAEIPRVISYQGKITDSGGIPITDGDYSMTFTIYDAASGGSSLWSSGAVTVAVSGGVFSVLLGDAGQPTLNLAFDADYWVETSIEGDAQSPRTRLGSAGYAYMASGIVPGTEVSWTSTYPSLKGTNLGSGAGLRGDSDLGIGVRGESAATNGQAVYGFANATTGTNYGIYGETNSTDGFAGYFQGRGYFSNRVGIGTADPDALLDVWGGTADIAVLVETEGRDGWAIYGEATATLGWSFGVAGFNHSIFGAGVYGQRNSVNDGAGVYGVSQATSGSGYGVYGHNNSASGAAVCGRGSAIGVWGGTDTGLGYGVYSEGNFAASGTKSCVVKTSQGPSLMYCQESPENWFEDFGEGQLVNGRCHVDLNALFLETVTIDAGNPMKVFVQLEEEDGAGLRIRRGLTGFDVEYGESNVAFWYRVVAKRKGFEDRRLDYCEAAERDTYLYPELREEVEREAPRPRPHVK